MKVFESKSVNFAYFLYRMLSPIFDPIKFIQGVYGYFWYINDLIKYKVKNPKIKLINTNLYPILFDKTNFTPFNAHYFYQQLWVFENVFKRKPSHHIDIASTYQMSAYLSKMVKTTFVDLRPISIHLKNLKVIKGTILNLPFKDNSIRSLSCLHVAEHIGLGRYGDPIDPYGTEKACHELERILAPKGLLYFSVPIGQERVCFNAHRIFSPILILKYFQKLKLIELSIVDDDGNLIKKYNPNSCQKINYGCGLFLFKKY